MRQLKDHLRLESAFDMHMQLGLRQSTDERLDGPHRCTVRRPYLGTAPSTPSTCQSIDMNCWSLNTVPAATFTVAPLSFSGPANGFSLPLAIACRRSAMSFAS